MAKTDSTGSYPCQGDSGQLQFHPCLSNFDHNYLIKQPDQPDETTFVSYRPPGISFDGHQVIAVTDFIDEW